MASSSWWPRATSAVSTAIDRLRRSRPGRVQTEPQAYRSMRSWKSRSSSVVRAAARSTCASPSTSPAHRVPAACTSATERCRSAAGGAAGGRRSAPPWRPAPRPGRGARPCPARPAGRPAPARRSRAARRPASGCRTPPPIATTGERALAQPPGTSKPASASQAQAYEASSAPARWSSSAPATAGSRSANPGPNQVCAAVATTALVPSARTSAARSCQLSGVPILAPVQIRAAPATRWSSSSCSADRTADRVARAEERPAGSASARTPSASSATVNGPVARRRRAVPGQVPADHLEVGRPARPRTGPTASPRRCRARARPAAAARGPPSGRPGERGDGAHGRDSRNTVSPLALQHHVEARTRRRPRWRSAAPRRSGGSAASSGSAASASSPGR